MLSQLKIAAAIYNKIQSQVYKILKSGFISPKANIIVQ